jgi:hypothetical protein
MKIRLLGELFSADGQTDMTKLTATFRNFPDAPKKKARISSSSNSLHAVVFKKVNLPLFGLSVASPRGGDAEGHRVRWDTGRDDQTWAISTHDSRDNPYPQQLLSVCTKTDGGLCLEDRFEYHPNILNLSWFSSAFEVKYWGNTCRENDSLLPDHDHPSVSTEDNIRSLKCY